MEDKKNMEDKTTEWFCIKKEVKGLIITDPPNYKRTPWGWLYTNPITGEISRCEPPKEKILIIKQQ